MKPVFADTFFYLALLNSTDSAHRQVMKFASEYQGHMVTGEWILTELADGMLSPGRRRALAPFLEGLMTDPKTEIIAWDSGLFHAGFRLYASREDKYWSLTDCISFEVMHRRQITKALTADRHFEQAGLIAVFA